MVASDYPTGSAVERFVRRIDRPESGAPLTVFVLHHNVTPEQRQAVLAELRERFPKVTISAIGDEIAVFSDVAQ
jgi:hypothetical protein